LTDLEIINQYCNVLNTTLINLILLMFIIYVLLEITSYINKDFYNMLITSFNKIIMIPYFFMIVIIFTNKSDFIINYYPIVKNFIILIIVIIIMYLIFYHRDTIISIFKNNKI